MGKIEKKEEKKSKKTLPGWAIAVIVVGFYVIGGLCFGAFVFWAVNNYSSYEENLREILIDKGNIVIERTYQNFYDKENNTFYITGYAENKSDKEYEYLELTFDVYDKDNNKLGVATATMNSLSPRETWKFKATYSEIDASEATTYKFSNADCF